MNTNIFAEPETGKGSVSAGASNNPNQKAFDAIAKSKTPLILLPEKSEGAFIAGALALYAALKKINANVQIAASSDIPQKFSYLGGAENISHDISSERYYQVSVNVGDDDIKELSYEKTDKVLTIYLTTKASNIREESFKVESSKYAYDLIIIISAPNMESLGRIYSGNKHIFTDIPVVRIGKELPKQNAGYNFVEASSSSISENISDMTLRLLPSGWDPKIANLLLAGIINETNNFQSSNISPKMFSLTASLMSAGADREEIIKHFVMTNVK